MNGFETATVAIAGANWPVDRESCWMPKAAIPTKARA